MTQPVAEIGENAKKGNKVLCEDKKLLAKGIVGF